jgi:4-hydroxy-3-polyprenylbenzoate decarboxylase
MKRVIIGITGASGAIYGIRALQALAGPPEIETHLIVTMAARATIAQETDWRVGEVEALADVCHNPKDIGASIASGSFATVGILVAPCSIKTLSAIANSYATDLISRAADVQLKEGRAVVLMVRETPLHPGHIRLMSLAAQNGAVIMPPVPAFYSHPQTVDDIVNGSVGRALARLGIENDLYFHWQGMGGQSEVGTSPGDG